MHPRKYLRGLYDECSAINIQGLMVGANKAHSFSIDELYIPLTTSSRLMTSDGDTIAPRGRGGETHHPGENISLDAALANRYTTIVGDPGSGKTTFVRHIAFILAGALLDNSKGQAIPGLPEHSFPIFIRVRELAAHMETCRETKKTDCPPLETDTRWLLHFLKEKSLALNWGLTEQFFREKLQGRNCVMLIDGLDEAPDRQTREDMCALIAQAKGAWPEARFIVTTRPVAYTGKAVLRDFHRISIAPLTDNGIAGFLRQWANAVHKDALDRTIIDTYYHELLHSLQCRPEIRRMAVNPVMLTALAVVHWNEKRLPEQRVELYDSIITWLLRSREKRTARPRPQACEQYLRTLALAMQTVGGKMRIQAGRKWAAEQIAGYFPGQTSEQRIENGEDFLREEEIDSGIIVGRGINLTFWHRSFQEFLAARALGGKGEKVQKEIILHREVVDNPDWREILLLFGGVLYLQGEDKINGFLHHLLDFYTPGTPSLTDLAQCAGLIGSIIRDLHPYGYSFDNDHYGKILDRVMEIFDKNKAPGIPPEIRVSAADALGQAGDPRFADPGGNWVGIPACTFLMGAQAVDPGKPNYDKDASGDESPVHEVTLAAYKIGAYPVTAGEYQRFILDGGYEREEYWTPEGWAFIQKEEISLPGKWEEQELYPTRPVTGVSWFEAAAFALWAGGELPTEAEWERAARGEMAYRKYPWGEEEPDGKIAHTWQNDLGHAAPVGIFPTDCTPEGIFDMGGNVWEWCKDWYDGEFYGKIENSKNPANVDTDNFTATGDKKSRLVRGGCFFDGDGGISRCSNRLGDFPRDRDSYVGFRMVVRSQAPGNPATRLSGNPEK